MFDSYSDADLIRLATDAPYDIEVRAELWDRADMDVAYGRGCELGTELERRGIRKPLPAIMSARVNGTAVDRYRRRWER
ncbi:gp231 [Mycobacterium phage Omega]|uniref:Uncharacterized protein n=1 Tax=Mycobacterium phage Omega TaxID=2907835 RepID=Q853T6_BPMOM|nr:gp231 [Mycobacterium phage Omega]AAN12872.1 hypothetical protein PBI_OMEGA_231 [Mycobacterium phage Omega]